MHLTGLFKDLVLDSVSPWNDPNGSWATYNSALASMFDPVYDIVADLGDVMETTVATLSGELSTASAISVLPVIGVADPLTAKTEISVSSGWSTQAFVLSSAATVGDTVLYVNPVVPDFAYPVGTPIQVTYIPGWSNLLDPGDCPDQYLPYLAQFNGTDVPLGLDPAIARAKIIGEGSQKRGTVAAIVSAIQRNLSGSQTVSLFERLDKDGNPNAYRFVAVVFTSEIATSQQDIIAAVNAIKPGGIQWTLILSDGWLIIQMEASAVTLSALEANFLTLGGLEGDRPGT